MFYAKIYCKACYDERNLLKEQINQLINFYNVNFPNEKIVYVFVDDPQDRNNPFNKNGIGKFPNFKLGILEKVRRINPDTNKIEEHIEPVLLRKSRLRDIFSHFAFWLSKTPTYPSGYFYSHVLKRCPIGVIDFINKDLWVRELPLELWAIDNESKWVSKRKDEDPEYNVDWLESLGKDTSWNTIHKSVFG